MDGRSEGEQKAGGTKVWMDGWYNSYTTYICARGRKEVAQGTGFCAQHVPVGLVVVVLLVVLRQRLGNGYLFGVVTQD